MKGPAQWGARALKYAVIITAALFALAPVYWMVTISL